MKKTGRRAVEEGMRMPSLQAGLVIGVLTDDCLSVPVPGTSPQPSLAWEKENLSLRKLSMAGTGP